MEKTGFAGVSGKKSALPKQECMFNPWVWKIPMEKEVAIHSGILAGESCGQEPGWAIVHGVARSPDMT